MKKPKGNEGDLIEAFQEEGHKKRPKRTLANKIEEELKEQQHNEKGTKGGRAKNYEVHEEKSNNTGKTKQPV